MVHTQMAEPYDRVPVRDPRVLEAMRIVPRHAFVPENVRRLAYADSPLPIGEDQTISQPYIVALMTELLAVTEDSRVLEIGTGSGYQAAVLAHLTPHVYTIEIVEPLARRAKAVLREQGYSEVKARQGDGYKGWPDAAPFDGIIVTCAAEDLPQPLWEQLRPGGRIVIPEGPAGGVQQLTVVHKTPEGKRRDELIAAVRFVPLTRERPSTLPAGQETERQRE
jgi:protein-L-isoaspartate(D-aspartate) O-methyltransferase